MSERTPDSESYLSEIDRRLESIQGELQPGRSRPNQPPRRRGRAGPLAAILGRGGPPTDAPPEPGPAEPGPAEPARAAPSALEQEVRAIGERQQRLIHAIEGLVEAYEAPSAGLGGEVTAVTLKAGPFADTAALRTFTNGLLDLPGVTSVAVRGFEGADRAIVDVELGPPARANT